MRRLLALAIVLAGLLGAALVTAPAASAHASLVSSDPVDGSRLASAPARVTVTFDESVGLNGIGFLHVVDQAGRRVDKVAATHPGGDGTKIAVDLKTGLGDGTYTTSYRVVSTDSHPVAGSIRFVVGNGALGAAISSPSTVDGATGIAYDVVRWLAFGGLALLGGGWVLLTVWPAGRDDRVARRLVWTGWVTGTVGALAELAVQGPYAAGGGLGELTDWTLLDATLHTTFGTAHSIRLVLLGVLGAVITLLLRDLRRTRMAEVAGLLAVGIALTYAASGHASAQDPRWLAVTSDTVHLAAMAAWLGGLVYLAAAVLPRRDADELREVLPMFSRTAFGSVTVLAVTGTYQAWLGLGSIDALTSTRYGQLVLVKIALFLVLIALGNLSRAMVQRRYVRPVAFAMTSDVDTRPAEPPAEIVRLRRSVLVEVGLAAVVLAVTSVLVAQPPGRAAAAVADADAKSQQTTIRFGNGRSATVTLDPGRHGSVTVTLRLNAGAKPTSLTVTAALPAEQLGPIAVPLTAQTRDVYTASGVVLPAAGTWEIDVTLRTSDFDSVVANGHVRLH